MKNPWGSKESEGEEVVVIDNEINRMAHSIHPLIQRKI